jgi:hypothetical protein
MVCASIVKLLGRLRQEDHMNSRVQDQPGPDSYKTIARHQWLTPVILATQEAEIRGIEV